MATGKQSERSRAIHPHPRPRQILDHQRRIPNHEHDDSDRSISVANNSLPDPWQNREISIDDRITVSSRTIAHTCTNHHCSVCRQLRLVYCLFLLIFTIYDVWISCQFVESSRIPIRPLPVPSSTVIFTGDVRHLKSGNPITRFSLLLFSHLTKYNIFCYETTV